MDPTGQVERVGRVSPAGHVSRARRAKQQRSPCREFRAWARWCRAVGEVVAYVRELLPAWCPQPSYVSAAAAQPPPKPLPPPRPLSPPSPWGAAWTTPTPAHVRQRYAPLRGEEVALVRPYVIAEERRQREAIRRELADAAVTRRLYALA